MIWQDIVISIASWASTVALLPSVFGRDKPAFTSSVFTGILVSTFGICYFTLELWSSALSAAVLAITWFVLAYQKWGLKTDVPSDKI